MESLGGTDRNEDEAPWVAWATLGFVVLGLGLRVSRYLLNFPLYCDETMIAANFLDRGYADLLRPLDYHQVGPLLWLAVELSAVRLFGFTEWSLRLFPFVCGMASVPLFRHVAGRLLGGVPLLLAVAIFAVSGWPLRYVAAVKPYASDLLVALGLLALAVEWRRRPDRDGWLWALAAAGPLAVAVSLPSLFVLGGIGLALAVPVWRSRRWRARAALLVFGAGVAVTFVTLMPFYKTAPRDELQYQNAWAEAFPPLSQPLKVPVWLLDVHTGYMFAYPEGAAHGASALTFLAFLVGGWTLARRGQSTLAVLLLAPFAFALLAASIHRYPYGVSARTTQYAAPMICLLTGLGLATSLAALPSPVARRRLLIGLTAAFACLGTVRFGVDLVRPYKTYTDDRVRDFARWFWTEQSRNALLVCAGRDLGVTFSPSHWSGDATDTYLCYQRIYAPRRGGVTAADLAQVSETRPLRIVLFNETPQHTPAFAAWMAEMLAHYRLRNVATYPVSSLEKKAGANWDELYLVYEFVPIPGAAPWTAIRERSMPATPRR